MITARNRFWSLLNNGAELVFGIGLVGAVTRLYPPDQAGTWFLFMAVFGLTGSLRDALIQSAMMKSVTAKDDSDITRALKTNLAVTLGFEFVSCLLVVIISTFMHNRLGDMLRFYPFYALPNALFRWQIFYLRGNLHIREILGMNVINIVCASVGILLIQHNSLPASNMLIVLGVANCISVFTLNSYIPYYIILTATVKRSTLSLIWRYGIYGMMREASSAVSSRINLFYSGALLTLTQTALLGVSQRFAQIALLPNNAFQSLLFPTLMKFANEGDVRGARKIFETSITQLLAITIPLAIIGAILSPYLLTIVSGKIYESAWGMLVVYMTLSTLITPFGAAFGSILTAFDCPGVAFSVVLVNSILNTILSYFLIRYMGLPGAPLALAITEVAGFLWIGFILRRRFGIRFSQVFLAVPCTMLNGIKWIGQWLSTRNIKKILLQTK